MQIMKALLDISAYVGKKRDQKKSTLNGWQPPLTLSMVKTNTRHVAIERHEYSVFHLWLLMKCVPLTGIITVKAFRLIGYLISIESNTA